MAIKVFKLEQTFPGSPELGFELSSLDDKYHIFLPELYPHLWKQTKSHKHMISDDGVQIDVGQKYWFLNFDRTSEVRHAYLHEASVNRLKHPIYSTEEEAYKAMDEIIHLYTEDGLIVGRGEIYTLLSKGNWTEGVSTVQSEYAHSLRLGPGKISPAWKYFRTKESRLECMIRNKPILSIQDLLTRLPGQEENLVKLAKQKLLNES